MTIPAVQITIRSSNPNEHNRTEIYRSVAMAHDAIRRWLLDSEHQRLVWLDDLNAVSQDLQVHAEISFLRV